MSQAYTQLIEEVHSVGRSWRSRLAWQGLLLTLAAALAALLLAVMIDQVARFAPPGRLVLAAAWWCAVGWCAWRWVVSPLLQRHTDDYFAALLEHALPGLGNRLINALQLGRSDAPSAQRLVDAIVNDGLTAVEQHELHHALRAPLMRRNAGALGIVVMLSSAYFLLGGPAVATSLARVMLPGADIAPFSWTAVTTQPEADLRILEGSPLTIHAQASGRMPDQAQLHLEWSDGQRRSMRMNQADPGQFGFALAAVDRSFSFYVNAGDGASQPVRVTVDPKPRVTQLSVTYHYPAYASLPDRTLDNFDGHLRGLPGTTASLTIAADKELETCTMIFDGREPFAMRSSDARTWTAQIEIRDNRVYRLRMKDKQGYEVDHPATYTITSEKDAEPTVAIVRPGRDVQARPDESLPLRVVAQDDLGVASVQIVASVNDSPESQVLMTWEQNQRDQKRLELDWPRTIEQLGLAPGDRMRYWAEAVDFNDISGQGPGRGQSRKYHLLVLTPEQAQAAMDKQLADYGAVLEELIRLQRRNRTETAEHQQALVLIERQNMIRRRTQRLAQTMLEHAFPGRSMIDELNELAATPMPRVIVLLESYRDLGADTAAAREQAQTSLPFQDQIAARLQDILTRINRNQDARQALKKLKDQDPIKHSETLETTAKLAQELDKFLLEIKDLQEKFEKLPKRKLDELSGEDLETLGQIEHRLDRWRQWFKDSVDGITKLPQGFVRDSALAENVSTIFEEIDKKPRLPTQEIATPVEEGIKAIGTKILEDLEIWMPDRGDSIRWVMEDPPEGTFQVPPYTLPDNLQDMVGDLIEDMEEFDESADDVSGSWGGNVEQAGWDIMDGPISSFGAIGKTGNQMPNASEITGRSGSGRRGKATGQMVGSESNALEGRPTPARLTNEPYEEGRPQASKQLDPRGATGGGKKTGGGERGLQGGTPPDFVADMERLSQQQQMLRERAQQVASQLEYAGRPASRVDRAVQLMQGAEEDYRDLRYTDAARKRKAALDEMRAAHSQIDQAVSLSLERAQHLPKELRQEISAGVQQGLPEGYEDLVGAYYKALSRAGSQPEEK